MTTELTTFVVTGNYLDVENPNLSGTTNIPAQQPITGVVRFWPRVPTGFVAYVADLDLSGIGGTSGNTAVAFAPIQARILSGQLQTIDVGGTVGISLLANTAPISAALSAQIGADWLTANKLTVGQLVYDVQFDDVVYGEAPQIISNFGFAASTDDTAVSLTDPNLTRLPYLGPK